MVKVIEIRMNVPGFANCHSHAFHRALRGRDVGGNDFWQWRDRMYALVAVLNAERYHRLARGVFAEMRLAGYTSVGEFHYLHRPDLAEAVIEAARAVGLRNLPAHHVLRAGRVRR